VARNQDLEQKLDEDAASWDPPTKEPMSGGLRDSANGNLCGSPWRSLAGVSIRTLAIWATADGTYAAGS